MSVMIPLMWGKLEVIYTGSISQNSTLSNACLKQCIHAVLFVTMVIKFDNH